MLELLWMHFDGSLSLIEEAIPVVRLAAAAYADFEAISALVGLRAQFRL